MNPHVNIHYRVTFVAASTSTTTTVGSSHPFQLFRNNQYEDDTTSNSPHHYRKFRTTGPIVTITIPHDLTSINTEVNDDDDIMDNKVPISVSTTPSTLRNSGYNKSFWKTKIQRTKHQFQSIMDTTLELLQPHCIYTIQTIPGQLPLPYWLPSLKSCTTRFQYATTTSPTSSCTPTISTKSSRHSSTIPTTTRSKSSRYSMEGLTKFEWNHKFFHQRNNVLQIAIQPYQEWITTTTTTRSTSNKQALSSSSSSILFHAKSGNANYAWLRCAISSSLPSSSSSLLSNLDHAMAEATNLSSSNRHQSSKPVSEWIPQQQQQQSYEASMRASTKILVPMASISSIRMTPTLRWIQQRRWPLSTPPLSQPTMSNAPPVTDPKQHRYHLYDTSCDVEVTSGGSGRTTATLTITPFSNMATMTGMTKKSIMTLAMEYRLSGGFNLIRRPWKPRTGRNGMITSTTRQQQQYEQAHPQHWIRQIWEWRPPLGSSTTNVPNSFRPMSMANGIIASQYQWLILWPSGQSVRSIFDPPSHSDWNRQNGLVTNGGVTFTWTDPTNQNHWNPYDIEDDNDAHFSGDGTWITDIRIPFVRPTSDNITRRTKSLLWQNLFATEIRIRRQFRF